MAAAATLWCLGGRVATCYPADRGDGGPFDDGVSECFGVFDLVSKLDRVDFCTSQQRLFLNNNAQLLSRHISRLLWKCQKQPSKTVRSPPTLSLSALAVYTPCVKIILISQLSSSPSIFYYHQFFILISVNGQIPFDMTKLLSKHKGFLYKMMIAALTHFCLAEFSRFSFTCKRSKCYQVQK